MKKIILILFVLASANILSAQTPAIKANIKPGWHKIGETTINFKIDNESILASGTNIFRAVKLKSTDVDLTLISIDIYYQSGDIDQVPLKIDLMAGNETAEIPLKTNLELKKVVFMYKTKPDSKETKAIVELFGLK